MAARNSRAPRKFVACRAVAVPMARQDGHPAGWGVWDFGSLRIVADKTGAFARSRAAAIARKLNTEARAA